MFWRDTELEMKIKGVFGCMASLNTVARWSPYWEDDVWAKMICNSLVSHTFLPPSWHDSWQAEGKIPEAQECLAWMKQNEWWVLGSHWMTLKRWDMIWHRFSKDYFGYVLTLGHSGAIILVRDDVSRRGGEMWFGSWIYLDDIDNRICQLGCVVYVSQTWDQGLVSRQKFTGGTSLGSKGNRSSVWDLLSLKCLLDIHLEILSRKLLWVEIQLLPTI